MKKYLSMICCVACVFLLSACGQVSQPAETTESIVTATQATVATSIPITNPTTIPTEPSVTEILFPEPGTPLSEEEKSAFTEMFTQEGSTLYGARVNYYNRLLSCIFEAPEQVDFTVLFLDQDADEAWELTDAEIAFLTESKCDLKTGRVVRVSSQKMDEVLQKHLGLTAEKTDKIGMENMVYFHETDCYYYVKYSFGELDVYFQEGTWLEDGNVEIIHNRNGKRIITLKRTDSGYIVLSNLRVEENPVEPPRPTETTPAVYPTESTEPMKPGIDPELWKTSPAFPACQDFFASDRIYENHRDGNRWIVTQDDSATMYTVAINRYVTVQSDAFSEIYTVPNSAALQRYEVLAADGKSAYLSGENRLIQLDLLTGEIKPLVDAEQLIDAYFCGGAVLYYAYREGERVYICRLYVPDMTNEILHTVNTPSNLFWLDCPDSTLGDVTWTTINPELLEHLKDALADPNSSYQKDGAYDYSDIWKAEDALTNPGYTQNLKWICYYLQRDTGIHALLQGRYHCADGSYTEKTGVFDDCSFGTSYPHDHFSPDVTTAAPPVIVNGSWMVLPAKNFQALPEQRNQSGYPMIYGAGFMPGTLYWNNNGSMKKLTEQVVTEMCSSEDTVYCISENQSILELSQDGNVCNTVYSSENGTLRELSWKDGMLYVVDGDSIVKIDIQNKQYRHLITHPDIIDMFGHEDGIVYFAVAKGMYYQQYLYNTITGVLEMTHWI